MSTWETLESKKKLTSRHGHKDPSSRPAGAGIGRLQQLAGNRAVGRAIQAKLEVGRVDDPHEVEAERMADLAMRRLAGASSGPDAGSNATAVPAVQRRPTPHAAGAAGGQASPATEALVNGAKGGGRPLDGTVQRSMEDTFQQDFSAVRVHDTPAANEASSALGAKAFTSGSDIFFGRGAYAPTTPSGQHLLAHELTHVAQQGGANTAAPIRRLVEKGNPLSPPKDAVKGFHNYRLYAKLGDPAPDGWTTHTDQASGKTWYQSTTGLAPEWSLPLELAKGVKLGGRFKNGVKELQRKLVAALGGRLNSGIWKRDGVFGSSTEKALKKFQTTNSLPVTGIADAATWKALDGQAGARQGQVDYDWSEKLTEFDVDLGERARFDWKKKDDALNVNVPIKFAGDTSKVDTIAAYIRQTWNVFDITYKGQADGSKARKPKNPKIKLQFDPLGKSAQPGDPTIQTSAEVFLWTGDHPRASDRTHLSDTDAKSRSDSGNWKTDLPAPSLKNMVGHEFGHLLGLEDEYSRGHEDIVRLTGKEINAVEDPVRYQRILNHIVDLRAALEGASSQQDIANINSLFVAWMGAGNQFADEVLVILKEYTANTGSTVGVDYEAAAKRVAASLKKQAHADIERLQGERSARATQNLMRHAAAEIRKTAVHTGAARALPEKRTTQLSKRSDKEARKEFRGPLNAAYGVAYDPQLEATLLAEAQRNRAWLDGHKTKGYSTGGLMGDYTKVGQDGADTRATSPALEHKHGLAPRHVRRFAEYVMKYKEGEIWEITNR